MTMYGHGVAMPRCIAILLSMSALAIETTGLGKVYAGKNGADVTAVSAINLHIEKGELFGLLGPNGAGKTTLVKMLCTLIAPSTGAGRVAGFDLAQAGDIRAAVGLVVPDERSFHWRLSARRNLTFFAAMYGINGRFAQKRIDELLHDVDLFAVADRPFGKFSSGMRQRLAIARSLLHNPQILFLDEPTRSLDPIATEKLHTLLLRLMAERDMTAFLITHDLAEAEKLCGRVGLMNNGRLHSIGRPADLRRQLYPYRDYRIETTEEVLTFRAVEGDGQLTAVIDRLRQQNATIRSIDSEPPSLEDVFMHTMGDG